MIKPSHWLSRILASRRLKLVLFSTVAVLIAVDLYASVLVVQQQHVMRSISRYSVTWLTSQAASELLRLQSAVGAYAAGLPIDRDEIQLRLDIVLNRVQLFESGEITDFLETRPDLKQTANRFISSSKAAQELVDHLPEQGAAQHLLTLLLPLNGELARLAAAAHDRSDQLMALDLNRLDDLYWIVSSVLILFICGSFGLTCILIWHNHLLVVAHSRVQTLVVDLQRSGEALEGAMHELRVQNSALQQRDFTLNTQNTRFDAALNNMSQALIMVDSARRLIVCNVRYGELFGLSGTRTEPGSALMDVIAGIKRSGRYSEKMIEAIWARHQDLADQRSSGSFLLEDEQGRALSVWHQPMADGGWVATYEDVTERRSAEAQIRHMAHHDALTGLANRRMFQMYLQQALGAAGRSAGEVAVHCIDLDFFKHVNDTMGHQAGDALLGEVAQRLRGCARGTDLVARLGGDEFAMIQVSASRREAEILAHRVLDSLRAPYDLGGRKAVIAASVGISLSDEGLRSPEQLFHNADLALYRSKATGRGNISFFQPEMAAEQENRALIVLDLRDAVGRNQFQVYYQPILRVEQKSITGYEALLRWRHPDRGIVMPSEFVPVAEETGTIVAIGGWALRRACMDAANWPESAKVAVNLSAVQFRSDELIRTVSQALQEARLDPERLELEITESVLLENDERVLRMLHQLRELGVRTVLDDFGTGYSSLSYLHKFPFDKIKVDKTFVRDMGTRADCLAILNSVSSLARELGMTSTAEGVETREQMMQLRAIGFTELQGYYIGVPAPAGQFGLVTREPLWVEAKETVSPPGLPGSDKASSPASIRKQAVV